MDDRHDLRGRLVGTARVLAVAASYALAACGHAAPRPAPAAVDLSEAPPARSSAGPAAAPPDEVLAAPEAVACVIAGRRVFSPLAPPVPRPARRVVGHAQQVFSPLAPPVLLCLAAAGPCFASAAQTSRALGVKLSLPEGDVTRMGALLELDDGHVVVRGFTRSADLGLYPRLLFTMGTPASSGDFVVPIWSVLEVESASRGTANVAVRLGAEIEVADGAVRAQRRCDELRLDSNRFKVGDVLRYVAGKTSPAQPKGGSDVLAAGKEIPLSASPGEPPSATLRPGAELEAVVEVIEQRGRDARIFWVRDGYAVFGWVPAAALRKTSHAGGNLMGDAIGEAAGPERGRKVVCNAEVALFVEVDGRHVEVGKVGEGTAVWVLDKRRGRVVVDLRGGPATLMTGASWALREAEATTACRL